MNKEQIIEGNTTIAIFDGWVKGKYENLPNKFHRIVSGQEIGTTVENLNYHQDWNLLMPVVEKVSTIDNQKFNVTISSTGMWACYIDRDDVFEREIASFGGFEPMIENVYKAVVKFITWHNQYKQQSK